MPTKIKLKCGDIYNIYTMKGVEYDSNTGLIVFIGNVEPRCRAKRITLFVKQINNIKYEKTKKKEQNK